MAQSNQALIAKLIAEHEKQLLDDWLARQRAAGAAADAETREHSVQFLAELRACVASGRLDDIQGAEWAPMRELLGAVTRSRTLKGFTPAQTATFVFSMKEPLFALLRQATGKDADQLAAEIWTATQLLDKLGIYTMEAVQRAREEVIARQQEELLDLSTPVVQLWDGVLALPLIGTLDSSRTQTVMENLLQQIVSTGAEIAIIDITGVPTVDTLVAQHLLKTIAAARLMGADCIISGIRPQIAQTIVHLGVELSVTSKATMAGAFEVALRRVGKMVVDRIKPAEAAE